jgi:hypothetical protein
MQLGALNVRKHFIPVTRSISFSLKMINATSIVKPKADRRQYDQWITPGNLIVTFISDPLLQSSGCAFAVGVGAANDPADYPGLAHFTGITTSSLFHSLYFDTILIFFAIFI